MDVGAVMVVVSVDGDGIVGVIVDDDVDVVGNVAVSDVDDDAGFCMDANMWDPCSTSLLLRHVVSGVYT